MKKLIKKGTKKESKSIDYGRILYIGFLCSVMLVCFSVPVFAADTPTIWEKATEIMKDICKIPKGKLTRWEDITAYLEKVYGVEFVKPADSYWEKENLDGSDIPYWRIVGPRGHLANDSRVGSKYVQLERLEEEGVIAELCNEQAQIYRVKNYKELLFDLSLLDEDEIKAIPNNDKKTTEVAASLMFQKENIYMIPTEILQRVASGKMHFDSEYVEKAQEELEKRKGKNQ